MSVSQQSASSTSSVVRRTLVVGAVVSAVGLVLSSSLFPHASQAQQPAAALAPAPAPANAPPVLVTGLPDFTQLVEKVGPAVVSIRTTQRVGGDEAGETDEAEAQMREFFRRFFGTPLPEPDQRRSTPRQGPGGQGEERPRGLGSGFIVSQDGYVLTNAHVVEGADEVYVNLTDKREFKAKVVGTDKRTDVAVLKIEASKLPAPVRVGDVNRLKVGEWVMAIGSPFGLENTVTAGIVSAKARDTGEEIRFIQTDVAINPGNSGGPLINMRGEVVGINSQIYSRSGGYMGISFAIPIDEANRVADQLKAGGRVVRGRIGVQIGEVSKEVAQSLGLPNAKGAQVSMVEPDGPANKAGIEPGDIILKFNGTTIERSSDLPRLVGGAAVNGKSTVTVWRKGAQQDIPVTVVELEGDKAAKKGAKEPEAQAVNALGLKVSDVPAAKKQELKIDGGVQVDDADGVAALAGLQPGDIILQLNNVAVKDAKQFNALVAKLDPKKTAAVLVRRGDVAQFVSLRPSAK